MFGWERIIILFSAFFVVSVVFMMFGQGGGAIYVPMLLAFGLPMYKAAATSQVLIIAATLSALLVFHKAKMIDWWLCLIIEPPTNVGAFLGGYFSSYFPPMFSKLVFAGILLIGAYFMIKPIQERQSLSYKQHWFCLYRNIGEYKYRINLLIVMPIMILAGFIAGMLGVGGGLFKVPALVLLGGVPMKVAVGSSSLMIGITALTGLFGHALVGHFDPRLGLILGLAVFSGAQVGARIGVSIDRTKHKKYFGCLLILVACWMIYIACP
ncbi:MAG: sulfite exporter TauE/SafE family protein [Deltaproteobacteria bacterium]|nr:sulfite exporter TauE/SafE family protein [Deltaproteobacteria bacterium]